MVAKLFWQDPYRISLDTRIVAVDGEWVRLEETIFYAFSGGQESDAGTTQRLSCAWCNCLLQVQGKNRAHATPSTLRS